MKKYALIPAFALLVSGAAIANDDGKGVYVGAKTGKFSVDVQGADDPTGSGFVIGYNFGGGGAIELERNSADIDVANFQIDMDNTALYFAFRSEGDAYLKVKAGILKEELSASSCGGCDVEDDDTGFSAGIGGGLNLGSMAQIEVEYTIIEADIDYLSAGLNIRF